MIFVGLGFTPHISYVVASLALVAYLLLMVLVYVRTSVVGEFKISYGRLGPTEIRFLAILLNIWMFFGGVRTSAIRIARGYSIRLSPYDLAVGGIALLLVTFFIVTVRRELLSLRTKDKSVRRSDRI